MISRFNRIASCHKFDLIGKVQCNFQEPFVTQQIQTKRANPNKKANIKLIEQQQQQRDTIT